LGAGAWGTQKDNLERSLDAATTEITTWQLEHSEACSLETTQN